MGGAVSFDFSSSSPTLDIITATFPGGIIAISTGNNIEQQGVNEVITGLQGFKWGATVSIALDEYLPVLEMAVITVWRR